jgi:hypothetical protein
MYEFMACVAKRTQATPPLVVGKENGAHIAMSTLGSVPRIRILMSAQRNTIVIGPAVSRYSRFLAGVPAGQVLIDGAQATGTIRRVGNMLQKDLLLPWRTVVFVTLDIDEAIFDDCSHHVRDRLMEQGRRAQSPGLDNG